MRHDHQAARRLRLRGLSYTEIHRKLGVSKSTLSGWFSALPLSRGAQERLRQRTRQASLRGLLHRNRQQTVFAQRRARQIQHDARQVFGSLSQRELLLLGTALYWAEGYKRLIVRNGRERTHHPVALTNADPVLVRTFLRFLRSCCRVPDSKIKIGLRIFPNQNATALMNFWRQQTGLPRKNFYQAYRGISRSSRSLRPFHRLPHGVAQVRVADTVLFHTIMGYIAGIKNIV